MNLQSRSHTIRKQYEDRKGAQSKLGSPDLLLGIKGLGLDLMVKSLSTTRPL